MVDVAALASAHKVSYEMIGGKHVLTTRSPAHAPIMRTLSGRASEDTVRTALADMAAESYATPATRAHLLGFVPR